MHCWKVVNFSLLEEPTYLGVPMLANRVIFPSPQFLITPEIYESFFKKNSLRKTCSYYMYFYLPWEEEKHTVEALTSKKKYNNLQ